MNLEFFEKLDSSNWSERYEGLDSFYDLVSMNPAGVSAHAIKVCSILSTCGIVKYEKKFENENDELF